MGKRKRTRRTSKAGTSKPRANWISTAILRSLADEANGMIDAGKVSYHSLTEFVCDAVRRRLEELHQADKQPTELEPQTVGAVPA